jgi:hypothetical protein
MLQLGQRLPQRRNLLQQYKSKYQEDDATENNYKGTPDMYQADWMKL